MPSSPERAPDAAVAPGSAWPGICEAFGLHMLVLAEQLRVALDDLEADEVNAVRLEQLYRIDHGVTRMRKASRDLRILAGGMDDDLAAPVTSLLDVIRMACSAIERYGQVRIGKVADLAVAGYAADDVASLLAALLENATDYSPDDVTVSAHLLDDGGVMFRVDDSGIGMAAEQVAALNALFAGPVAELDERSGRHTGFPVVHRIARVHQITVRMSARPAPRSGLLAMVTLPPHLLCEVPEEDEASLPVQAGVSSGGRDRGTRAPGPRDAPGPAAAAGAPASSPGPGELPRRESASLRGDRPRREAAEPLEAARAADESAARRAFADEVAAFVAASTALGSVAPEDGDGPGGSGDGQEGTVEG